MATDEKRQAGSGDTSERDEIKSERPARREARSEAERSARPRERGHVPAVEESIPVFGGRLLVAAGLLAAMVVIPMSSIGNFIEPKDPTIPNPKVWQVGQQATVAVTVITADYNKLACASDKEVAGMHCQYKNERDLWPRAPEAPLDDNKANVIQPYRTWLDNQLVLIGGLWAEPNVAMRLHREPPLGVAEDKLARFVAECKVRFVGELPGVKLRWAPGGTWGDPDTKTPAGAPAPPLVAKVESCTVSNPQKP